MTGILQGVAGILPGCIALQPTAFTSDPGGLPVGATGYIDFQAGTFYFGSGTDTLDDVLFQDDDGYGSSFDLETDVTAAGLIGGGPALRGNALSQILPDGATCVAEVNMGQGSGESPKIGSIFYYDLFHAPAWDFDWTWFANSSEAGLGSQPNAIRTDGSTIHNYATAYLTPGVHKFGITFEPGKWALSIDGSASLEDLESDTWTDRIPNGFGIDATSMNVSDITDAGLQKFIIYPAKYGADLQAVTALD